MVRYVLRAFSPRNLILPAFAAAFLGYFAFHAFHGSYGIMAKARFDSEAETLSAQLDSLTAERSELEQHMALLRPTSLGPDMIDERAREQLNMLGPNEVLILDAPAADRAE